MMQYFCSVYVEAFVDAGHRYIDPCKAAPVVMNRTILGALVAGQPGRVVIFKLIGECMFLHVIVCT
jgi:hypothetical protein